MRIDINWKIKVIGFNIMLNNVNLGDFRHIKGILSDFSGTIEDYIIEKGCFVAENDDHFIDLYSLEYDQCHSPR